MAERPGTKAIVAAAEIEAADLARLNKAAAALGVDVVHEVAETSDELLATLRRHPDAQVMLSDFLPDVPGSASMYAFDKAGGGEGSDTAAEQSVLDAIASVRWVQLPSVGIDCGSAGLKPLTVAVCR